MHAPRRPWMLLTIAAVTVTFGACAMTESARRSKGEELLRASSNAIANAKTIRFVVDETDERVTRRGDKRVAHLDRQVAVRRPDRFWFRTSGGHDMEGVYDGAHLTLIFHRDKVFGMIPTPATLDETVDVVSERYDIPLPVGDLITSNPHGSLISTKTTGGWQATETVNGVPSERLDWHHPNVDWSIWIPASGTPLPTKLFVNYKTRRRTVTAVFKNWDLTSPLPDETFQSRVPPDYEGIAVIQRAAAVAGDGKQEPAPATTSPQE